MFDFDELMQPIDADAPCGPDMRDDPEFRDVEDAPAGFADLKPADLRAQVAKCDALLRRTKDQSPAIVATQAAMRVGDFALAGDALRLIKGFADTYWDEFHPGPADEMLIARVNELGALAKPGAMVLPLQRAAIAALPAPSTMIFTAAAVSAACEPVAEWSSSDEETLASQVENGQMSATVARTMRPTREGARVLRGVMRTLSVAAREADAEADVDAEDLGLEPEALHQLATTLRTEVAASREALSAVSDLLYDINAVYDQRGGDSASLGPVQSALRTVVADADRFLATFAPAEPSVMDGADADAAGDAGVGAATGNRGDAVGQRFVASVPQSRADVHQALNAIRQFYREREPGSPLPLLLTRAQAWVDMDFLQLMAEIAPSGVTEAEHLLVVNAQADDDN